MTVLLQDLRFALRMIARSPGFTSIVICTLALGICANTVVFSVVNGVLLNPLPYPQSAQLAALYSADPTMAKAPISYLNFLDWERLNRSFSSIAIYRHEDYNLTETGRAERVNGLMVSAAFFRTLGVHPMLGRDLVRSDDHIGAAPVALVSDGFRRRHFGAAADVLGKVIQLDGVDYTIVGVMPPGFSFYGVNRDVFVPIGRWDDPSFHDRRVDVSSHAIGRLEPGVTLAQAQSEMDSIARQLAIAYPEADKGTGIAVLSMKDDMVGNVQPILMLLLAAVAFLLLISCCNVSGLLLARSMRRSGEFALRAAIGAGRRRIVRQLLTESTIIALAGGGLGILLALSGTRTVLRLLPEALPRSASVTVDLRVMVFTLALSLLSGIGFGLIPALKSSNVDLQQVLRRSAAGGGSRHRLQEIFVAAQIALTVVLLAGAGLMLRSLAALWRVDPGYQPDHAITFSVSFPSNARTTEAETRARLRQFDASMRAISGVEAVSVTLGSRPMIHDSEIPFWIVGRPQPASNNDMPQAMFYLVEAGFQKAMGMTLERGRFVSPQDRETFPVVVDIDDVFARTYFPDQDPIGKRIHIVGFDLEAEIVGVVGHIRQWGPGNDSATAIEAQFYYPFMQLPTNLMRLAANGVAVVVRTHGDAASVIGPLRQAVTAFDPHSVIYGEETMNEVIARSLAARRLTMILLSTFAALALALSCIGTFGVISYMAQERTREIGVRMALGARRTDVVWLVLGKGARITALGLLLGLALALGLTRTMSTQIFGVSPYDPVTFGGVAVILAAVGLAACYLPARKATRVDPMIALRAE